MNFRLPRGVVAMMLDDLNDHAQFAGEFAIEKIPVV